MFAVSPEGRMRTFWPIFIWPASIVPAKPLKSKLGRLTHCTGIRKGSSVRRRRVSTVSRNSIRVRPLYHSVCLACWIILQPFKADIGIGVMDSKLSLSTKVSSENKQNVSEEDSNIDTNKSSSRNKSNTET